MITDLLPDFNDVGSTPNTWSLISLYQLSTGSFPFNLISKSILILLLLLFN